MVFGRPSRARYHKFMSFPDFPQFLWIFEENVFLGGKYAEFMKKWYFKWFWPLQKRLYSLGIIAISAPGGAEGLEFTKKRENQYFL